MNEVELPLDEQTSRRPAGKPLAIGFYRLATRNGAAKTRATRWAWAVTAVDVEVLQAAGRNRQDKSLSIR